MKLFSKAALAVVLVFTLMLSGCSLFEPDEKSFSKAGMTVTLTEAFVEQDVVNYTATYVSTKIMVIYSQPRPANDSAGRRFTNFSEYISKKLSQNSNI